MSVLLKIKELLFGKSPDQERYMLYIYAAGLLVLILAIGFGYSFAKAKGARVPFCWVAFMALIALIVFGIGMRIMLSFVDIGDFVFSNNSVETENALDYEDIEVFVFKKEFLKAIEEYQKRFEDNKEEVIPLFRIADIYWLKLGEYKKAIETLYKIAQKPVVVGQSREEAITKIMEIYRHHLPDSPEFLNLCKWVLDKMPGSFASKIAKERLSKGGV
ncbi:hypothetical protein KAH81_07865 [bacterium]|nr:hypothetical protein [bacterium]